MTKVVTVTNQKGGTGKTATTVNLATALAKLCVKVLVIDFDPQGNTSKGFGFRNLDSCATVVDFLHGVPFFLENRGVSVIPADKNLARCQVELSGMYSMLYDAMGSIEPKFDVILIDTPPALGFFTLNAIVASDHVICPSQAEYDSVKGIDQLNATIDKANRKLGAKCKLTGILVTMFDQRLTLHRDMHKELKRLYPKKIYKQMIPRNVAIAEAALHFKDVHSHSPNSFGSVYYEAFAEEFMERGFR